MRIFVLFLLSLCLVGCATDREDIQIESKIAQLKYETQYYRLSSLSNLAWYRKNFTTVEAVLAPAAVAEGYWYTRERELTEYYTKDGQALYQNARRELTQDQFKARLIRNLCESGLEKEDAEKLATIITDGVECRDAYAYHLFYKKMYKQMQKE